MAKMRHGLDFSQTQLNYPLNQRKAERCLNFTKNRSLFLSFTYFFRVEQAEKPRIRLPAWQKAGAL